MCQYKVQLLIMRTISVELILTIKFQEKNPVEKEVMPLHSINILRVSLQK